MHGFWELPQLSFSFIIILLFKPFAFETCSGFWNSWNIDVMSNQDIATFIGLTIYLFFWTSLPVSGNLNTQLYFAFSDVHGSKLVQVFLTTLMKRLFLPFWLCTIPRDKLLSWKIKPTEMPQSVFPLVPTWVRFVSLLIYCNFASTADFKSNNQAPIKV